MAGRVLLDLNAQAFLDEFLSLDKTDMVRVARALKKISSMDWATFIKHPGSRWEQIGVVEATAGKPIHSLRLSQKYRALGCRDGDYLRLASLHLDHDSAYKD